MAKKEEKKAAPEKKATEEKQPAPTPAERDREFRRNAPPAPPATSAAEADRAFRHPPAE